MDQRNELRLAPLFAPALDLHRRRHRSQFLYGYAKPAEVEGDAFQMVAAYNPDEEYLVAMSEPNEPIVIYHFKLASGTPCRDEVGEPVFNLFLYVIDGLVKEVGIVRHYFAGTDTEKKSFLQSQVQSDFARAKRYRLPSSLIVIGPNRRRTTGIRYGAFLELAQSGKHLMLFEEAFRVLDDPNAPLYCVTPVVNGVPKVDVVLWPSSGAV